MKYIIGSLLFILLNINYVMPQQVIHTHDSTALLLIDIQEFYFEGEGKLTGCEEAEKVASRLLSAFRDSNLPVIHVMHGDKSPIRREVAPREGEKLIVKHEINSFKGTDLLEYLQQHHIRHLVLCGMMTHMCLEAATRAASDYGFDCTVIQDACATRDLTYDNVTVKARDVHFAALAALTYYATITQSIAYLKNF